MATSTLQAAKYARNDEFYTQLPDIENELKHYKDQFRNKVVFCNCDDPYESNFFKFFASKFNDWELKKLIATCYKPSPIAYTELVDLWGNKTLIRNKGMEKDAKSAYRIEITEVIDYDGDGATNLDDVAKMLKELSSNKEGNSKNKLTKLIGNGDFRSPECIELLKQADIICTNPPFSLFREYIDQLMQHGKKFLIIGNDNLISLKEFFRYIKENKVWVGYGRVKQFLQPDGTMKKFGNVGWWTNLDTTKRHENLTPYKRYTPEEYPKYHNYDAIEVSKVANIPMDYDGEMGVPITFLDKYNPEQFEIIGSSSNLSGPIKTANGLVYRYKDRNGYMRQAANERFALPDGDTWRRIYDRIVIKRKKVEKEIEERK